MSTPRDYEQWINWTPIRDGEKTKKRPTCYATGRAHDAGDPRYWLPYSEARANSNRVGYVLTPADPWVCIDIDGATDHPLVKTLRTYTERSPSGNGLHLWLEMTDSEPLPAHAAGLEVYSAAGYVTVTGDHLQGTPRAIRRIGSAELLAVLGVAPQTATQTAQERPHGVTGTDEQLWTLIMAKDRTGRTRALYNGDQSCTGGDHSRALFILARTLGLYTNGDHERVKALLHQTALPRDRWDDKRGDKTWLDYQIDAATCRQGAK